MASWLQAQLKAAENLLEAVDRTVSATTGVAGVPGDKEPGGADTTEHQTTGVGHQSWQQGPSGVTQSHGQLGSGPAFAANVSKGLSWLQGSPKTPSSPSQGSPSHPAAAAARTSQPAQLWQPYKPQSPSSGAAIKSKLRAHGQSSPAPGSPAHSRATATAGAATTAAPASLGSTGSFSSRMQGTFNSSSSSQQVPHSSQAPPQPGPDKASKAQQGPTSLQQLTATERVASNGDVAPAVSGAAVVPGPADAHHEHPVLPGPPADDFAQPHTSGLSAPARAPAADVVGGSSQQAEHSSAGPADAPSGHISGHDVTAAAPTPAAGLGEAVGTDGLAAVSQRAAGVAIDHTEPAAPAELQQHQQEPGGPSAGAAAEPSSSTDDTAASPAAADAAVASAAADPPGVSGPSLSSGGASSDGAAGSSSGPAAAAAASAAGGPAKEAQLTRLVETLRKRLEVVRGENQQLEDMLHEAEQRSAAEQARIASLAAELTALQREQEGLVSSASANAAAQDAHIGRLQAELEASSRQVAALQAELTAVQEQHAQALSSKDSMEGGALEALRAEVATYEGQLEAERKAHAITKATAASRERDLEEQLGSSSEALAATQRQLEEAASRAREAEEQQLLAAAEAARLQQQVQLLSQEQSGTRQPDPHLQLQLEAEREAQAQRLAEAEAQVVTALQAQRAAEARVAELQAEVSHLHSSYQAQAASRGPPQLEQQLRELQELLYQKQQQLERLSGEKQAQQLMLERQITSLKSELGKAHAAAAAVVTGASLRSGHDIIPMDALGEPYQRLARHNKLGGAVQATANFLDTTAASASQLLRQQPLARLIVFLYIVLIHLYVYFLLARMQKQALLLVSQQDKAAGFGPERLTIQAPPTPVLTPPLPPGAGGQP